MILWRVHQKILLKLFGGHILVKVHLLSKFAWIRKTHDVCMTFEAEDSRVVLMILKSSLSYPDVVPLSKPLVLGVEDLCMPDLVGVIDGSNLRSVLIKLEHL